MDLPILYEDAEVVAIAKPSGLLTHAPDTEDIESADRWFKTTYPQGSGYVHRLDKDTSGVLLFAKHENAYEFLRTAFRNRDVHKTYVAFIYGVPKDNEGVIDFDIGRSRKDFRLRSAQPKAKGRLREAVTRYNVIASNPTHSLVEVHPETGRTHQIRVHFKAIHHPIVCDPLYAPNHTCDLDFNRLGLHAYSLDIPLLSGARQSITAPIPYDLVPGVAHFPGVEGKFALE